eukprot:CAMPEP_0197435354 /NCGR_PEP_ID=MMETSP1175-20131217/2964_1 /TAXON_ID=1003142 /ORGANISM="Triceratium dubium, Strain CCMP147" /LENGTH=891 /DNA_ID=CAMNT_0042964381 /DNA_START=147 /DNA_END=2822 /DNA_ORIENTATION=-
MATYAESTSSGRWIAITSLVAVTFQLIRVSIDLIQVASAPKADSGNSNNTKESEVVAISSKYGSTDNSDNGNSDAKTNSGNVSSTTDEEQSLVTRLKTTGTAETSPPNRRRWIRVHLFATFWVVLFAWFVTASIAMSASTMFPVGLTVSSSVVVALEALLLKRDVDKSRQNNVVQRFLHFWTALLLWLEYVTLWLDDTPKNGHSAVDRALLVAASIHFFLVVLEGWLITSVYWKGMTATQASGDSETAASASSTTKATLSRKAMTTLLKPYFWPDATDTSAFWNRLRAIATWFFVVASKAANLASPLFLGWASTALAHEDYAATIRYSILYSVISWLGTTFKECQSLVYLKVAQAAYVQLSTTAFGHLHSLSLDWHLRKKMGVVLRSMSRGIAACDTLMKYMFLWLVPALAECLVVCVIFATYFSYLPLAIAVFYFVFLYVVLTIMVTLWRKKFRKNLTRSDNEKEDLFVDSMINFETVKYFTAEAFEQKRYAEAVQRYQTGSVHVQASLSTLNISQQVILKVCLATALSLAALGIEQRNDCCLEVVGCDLAISECCKAVSAATCPGMEVGDFVAVLTYTLNLFAPLNFLGSVYNAVVMAVIDLTNMSELLAESPDVSDAPDAMDVPSENSRDPDMAIEFDNVVFHYPTQPSTKGLKGLSFRMKRGTTTAIVGPTGAGKTTVSRLLFRFYDVLGGAVKVNGVDVRSVTQKSLREAIGVVPQAASLFNDTIRNNLLYGRRDATEEELVQAARDAQLLDFIESLAEGWDTIVGDRGLKLSGGEKQRAAICRCLLKDPDFVLLDEATSALDTLTENSVQEALDRLGERRTVLVIAHRLGTIRNADNIIVLKDGVAAEQGTHDELLARDGIYADMWNMQLHSTSASASRNSLSDM